MVGHAKSVEAFIAVGSNIEPVDNIQAALVLLAAHVVFRAVSTFYRTEALGQGGQADYRNGVWKIETEVEPEVLKFEVIRPIEHELGRVRTTDPYAARTIDLDIVIYGDRVLEAENLVLPDPEIRRRAFVAVPLLELAPHLCLPDTGEALAGIESAQRPEELVPDIVLTRLLKGRINP